MLFDEQTCWVSIAPDQLLTRSWDDELLIFHRQTGATHILDAAHAELLALMSQEPLSAADIAERLAQRWHEQLDADFRVSVGEGLHLLEGLEIIRRAT